MKMLGLPLLLLLALLLAGCSGAASVSAALFGDPGTVSSQEGALTAEATEEPPSSAAPANVVPPSPTPVQAPATPVPTPKPGTVTAAPILMYHYVRELPPNTTDHLGYGLSIAPKLFEDELAYLAGAGYTSVSMEDLVSHITRGTPLPPKPIVLTFDDGYSDFYMAAWPLLKKYGFGATAYLVVDFLGKPGYLSWQQTQELRDSGIEIGAHTLDHVDLAIQGLPQARRQIFDSRQILQQRLNAPVNTFAYPSGRYTTSTVKLVGEAGFSSAVTTAFGERHTTANLLTLARIRVSGGISMLNFIKNLAG
jgi:peptidoglycan/xylan/chitin deacetylase (PgdA/CDA1 family)